ncbi:MAG: tRNA uridine-5-carboxymethylaminomethyl(34) synthesis GTPase MnmE [Bacillota bacterium]|nr:tRNA uridine-5-carboxymethylaminomethyl(34) synthesis GTPase MnmE [Bacillota bacterium]MDW7684290.1 tRNA uridine-5-carboxymethylaminomethyl(34) synthesis GTPase MnmE [Bacillota bacterium]
MIDDTIAAISTPPGEGGIGIVRVSGPLTQQIVTTLFSFAQPMERISSHRLYYGKIVDPADGHAVDEALVSLMRAPHTYTREDVAEFNCHGGIMPLAKTLELILAQGARLAEPGEFTQRAFLNGRIDLAQAEAVIGMIRARSEAAMHVSMSQLTGRLSGEIRQIRRTLLAVLAHMEASIDFPEHQDVEEFALDEVRKGAEKGLNDTEQLLETADRGRILREGIRTAIIGRPNVGKSSLLNAMLREQRAIVTDIPGTTRDVLEESINLGGVALTIVDTAGIRETMDEVEKIGVARSRAAIGEADLILYMMDITQKPSRDDLDILRDAKDKPSIVIVNKTDLLADIDETVKKIEKKVSPLPVLPVSVTENRGLAELEKLIISLVFQGDVRAPQSAMVTSARHKDALRRSRQSLVDLLAALDAGYALDLLAIDLHAALDALGEITGETVGADLAAEIFSTFCIGK